MSTASNVTPRDVSLLPQAKAVLKELQGLRSTDALAVQKPEGFQSRMRNLEELTKRAESSFGVVMGTTAFTPCSTAATYYLYTWQAEVGMLRSLTMPRPNAVHELVAYSQKAADFERWCKDAISEVEEQATKSKK